MDGTALTQNIPEQIRVSIGTAAVLGLQKTKLDAAPTTAYLMTYHNGKCTANCSFCPQARLSSSKTELLSRVTWPSFATENVTSALTIAFEQGKIKRVCIQALNYPEVFAHLQAIVKKIKQHCDIPVSVSCQPLNKTNIRLLKAAGVDRLGIALDGATEAVFNNVKGDCYRWARQFELFVDALDVFGEGNVSTHVIVGLGESEKEAVEIIQRCVDLGVLPALFAFTPVRGTALEGNSPPKLDSYRRVQLARYLIAIGKAKAQCMGFDGEEKIVDFGLPKEALQDLISDGVAFQTSGCSGCNRPYYNEKPSGPIYNYPRKLNKQEIKKIKADLE
jgi:biotin synthase